MPNIAEQYARRNVAEYIIMMGQGLDRLLVLGLLKIRHAIFIQKDLQVISLILCLSDWFELAKEQSHLNVGVLMNYWKRKCCLIGSRNNVVMHTRNY